MIHFLKNTFKQKGITALAVLLTSGALITTSMIIPAQADETKSILLECTPVNSSRGNGNPVAVSFHSQGDFIWENAIYREYTDDTANLTGIVSHRNNEDKAFDINVNFSGRIDPSDANYPPEGSPREEDINNPDLDTDNWYYFTEFSGTFLGIRDLDGALVSLTRRGRSPQIGIGAVLTGHDKNRNDFGLDAWYYANLEKQSKGPIKLEDSTTGDIHTLLKNCVEPSPTPTPTPEPTPEPTPTPEPDPISEFPPIIIVNDNENINQNLVEVGDTLIKVAGDQKEKKTVPPEKPEPVPVTAPTGAALPGLLSLLLGGSGLAYSFRRFA